MCFLRSAKTAQSKGGGGGAATAAAIAGCITDRLTDQTATEDVQSESIENIWKKSK